jgi:nicotinamide-nucleotide amidase
MTHLDNPTLAPYAKEGEVLLRVTARASSDAEADEMMNPVIDEVKSAVGDFIYGIDTSSLEETVLNMLKERGLTLSTAESCTGGLVSKRLTDIPGASAVFLGGAVTYSNSAKEHILGVDGGLLAEKGAVSSEVAVAMAAGARRCFGTDIAVSLTGLAGPDSDESGQPVGLVYIGYSDKNGDGFRKVFCGSPRSRCRIMAANYALDTIRRRLSGLKLEDRFM